ncbi:MAG TPA: class I SAM-dependent methyltransferase, partial [Actinotalea sp.]|nr:class I SAM-dependent methyltransferase [Actinotalea sp.]
MTTTLDERLTPPAASTPSDLLTAPAADAGADEFATRVLAAALGSLETTAVHLGERLGWYRALAEHGPLTSAELARETGTVERYAREWLEHQAASGYLGIAETDPTTGTRRFRLHPGAAEVLTDIDSLSHMAPLARLLAGTGRGVDRLLEAYRGGGGVSWADLGADAREAQAAFNRPMFLHQLTQELLPSLPDLHARLEAGATVADVGCGEGWSAIGLARGYRSVRVDGFDIDAPSVEAA